MNERKTFRPKLIVTFPLCLLLLILACSENQSLTEKYSGEVSTISQAIDGQETDTSWVESLDDPTSTAALIAGKSDGAILPNGAIMFGGKPYGGIVNGFGDEPVYGGIATFSHRTDLPGSDPMFQGSISLHNVGGSMWGRGNLLRVNRRNNFQVEGFLAKTWNTTDFKTWTFEIHPNIKWHDGVHFTAEDVAYWVNLAVFPSEGRRPANFLVTSFRDLERVNVLDPLTIEFVLNKPRPNWPEELASRGTVITHPRHLVQSELDQGHFRVQPNEHNWVSIGPFKFESYDDGVAVKVRRYAEYFERDEEDRTLPFMDGIDYAIIRDRGSMVSAFRAGRLDGTSRGSGFGILPEQERAITRDLGENVWFGRVLYVGWGPSPNLSQPPWDDFLLRKALSLYTDRATGSLFAFGGNTVPGAMWTPGSPWANQDVVDWPGYNQATKIQDQKEAMRIVREGGWEGLITEILCRDIYIDQCEWFDSVLTEMGFQNSLKLVDYTGLAQLLRDKNYTMYIASNIGSMPGPKATRYVSSLLDPRNSTHQDVWVDALFDEIATTVDSKQRNRLTREVEQYVMQEKLYKDSWFHEVTVVAYRSWIKGMPIPQMNLHDNTDHATTWIDDVSRKLSES